MSAQKLLLIVCALQASILHTRSCGLDDFVRAGLTRYTTWLKNNNLDPSPVTHGPNVIPFSSSVADLQLQISNHGIRGYSDAIVIDYVMVNPPYQFTAGFQVIGNVTFHGDHRASGTINHASVSVDGTWYIKSSQLYASMFFLTFEETPLGYLNVTDYTLYNIEFRGPEPEIYFEGLSDHDAAVGSEAELHGALLQGFSAYLVSRDDWDLKTSPFRNSYIQYWRDVLSQTTMNDIYGPTAFPEKTNA